MTQVFENMASREVSDANLGGLDAQREVYETAFPALASSEMHALTYILAATNNGPFSRADLQRLINDAQGETPEWKVGTTTAFNYIATKFAPLGVAETFSELRETRRTKAGEHKEVCVVAIKASEQVSTKRLALAGAMLDWSLGSERSIVNVFGRSRPSKDHEGAAVNRRRILRKLVNGGGISEIELSEAIALQEKSQIAQVGGYLKDMVADGLLVKSSASDWDERTFTLTGEGVRHKSVHRSEVSPETLAVYDVADIFAVTSLDKSVSAQMLYDTITTNQPELDKVKLRHIVSLQLSTSNSSGAMSIPSVVGSGSFGEGTKTKFSLSNQDVDEIADLLDTLDLIEQGDEDYVDHYAARACEIAADKQAVNAVVKKAKSVSPVKQALSDNEMLDKVSLALQSGPMTVKQLAERLRDHGTRFSVKGLDNRVRRLIQDGRLLVEERELDSRTIRMANFITAVVVD